MLVIHRGRRLGKDLEGGHALALERKMRRGDVSRQGSFEVCIPIPAKDTGIREWLALASVTSAPRLGFWEELRP